MPSRYKAIAEQLLTEFQTGNWIDGAALPSESRLQETFGASRTTVRHALALLETEGRVERRQGRRSFYRSRKIGKPISSRVDFRNEARSQGQLPYTRALALTPRSPGLAELAVFGFEARAGVVELRRLLLLDGQPTIHQSSVLCHPGIADLQLSDFENTSLYGLLKRRFKLVVTKASKKLEAVNAPHDIANLMSIEPGAAMFKVHRVVEDQHGRVIELSSNFVRADRYYFSFSGSTEDFGR